MFIKADCVPPSLLRTLSSVFATRFELNPIPLPPTSSCSSLARSNEVFRLQPVAVPFLIKVSIWLLLLFQLRRFLMLQTRLQLNTCSFLI